MPFPSFEEYTDTLQLPLAEVLSDPLLADGEILKNDAGRPIADSGNFALTYQVVSGGRRYALRCFHKETEALQLRYEAISRKLQSMRSPHFVHFEYQPSGITTESGSYPVVRMDWADGETLARFVARNRHDSAVLRRLRLSLHGLAAHLSEHGIAHGDIQPANIIARNELALKLVDYDGMFVPELAPMISSELGQRNFQHPRRTALQFDQRMDVFSFCLLDFVLEALALQPDLWESTGSDEQAFLLRASDYADPAGSHALRLISRLPEMETRTRHFAAICLASVGRLPSFEDFVAGCNIPDAPVVLDSALVDREPPKYVSAYPVVQGADFARCCAHIGDRVELIGRIVRAHRDEREAHAALSVRLEFGVFPQDLVCAALPVEVWRTIAHRLDEDWTGKWISVLGLMSPVVTGNSDGTGTRFKYVSIEVDDAEQCRLLTEAEALYRLGESGRPAEGYGGTSPALGTDPVLPDRLSRPADSAAADQPVVPGAVAAEDHAAMVSATADTGSAHRASHDLPGEETSAKQGQSGTRAASKRRDDWLIQVTPTVAAPVRRSRWLGAVLLALALVTLLVVVLRGGREQQRLPANQKIAVVDNEADRSAPSPRKAETVRVPLAATPSVDRSGVEPGPWPPSQAELLSVHELNSVELPVESIAGPLGLDDDERSGGSTVTINGEPVPGLTDDIVALVYQAVFSDRDVVLGYTDCLDGESPCNKRRPFWLVLAEGRAPVLHRSPEIWTSREAGEVTALASGVHADLGVWDGVRRIATLTARDQLYVTKMPEPPTPLDRAGCATVARALDNCSRSTDCVSFASAADRIPLARMRELNRLFHETTGLDVVAFDEFCRTSCELAITPSYSLIRREVCSGSPERQWEGGMPGTGSRGATEN